MKDKNKVVGHYNKKQDLLLCKGCFEEIQAQDGFEKLEKKDCKSRNCECNKCEKSLLETEEEESPERLTLSSKIIKGVMGIIMTLIFWTVFSFGFVLVFGSPEKLGIMKGFVIGGAGYYLVILAFRVADRVVRNN